MVNRLLRPTGSLLPALILVTGAASASGQVLLRDDFDQSGIVDSTVWRLPFEGEGVFVGRTQYRGDAATDMPLQGVAEPLASDGSVMEVHLDTFSPIDPGNQFLGTDLLTKRNFAAGGGVSFEARMRLKPTTAGGLVNGFFMFDVTRDSPPGSDNLVRDEIDWELISNQATGAASNNPFTNVWNDGDFGDGGSGQFHDVPGLDLTQFQDYRVDWTPQSVRWYVNDTLVRTESSTVPDDPMNLHVNLWAPDSTFAEAFNAALQPTAVEANNERFTVQVDHVEVSRFDTALSENLLTDGSFEAGSSTPIQDVPATTTGVWLDFGNVSVEADDFMGIDPNVPDTAPDGIFMAKMFGPFNGGPDASGVLQNVAASPGEVFEASVKALTPAADTIAGTENFNTLALSFLDSSGNVIQEALGDVANLVDANGHDFPLLDGRDPNLLEDVFVEGTVNAVAPAGTAYARLSLFFIQLANEGGASWFDDAQLVRLTQQLSPTQAGDFNRDGVVDAADYVQWRNNEGGDESALGMNGNGDSSVDQADLTLWKNNYGAVAPATAVATPEPGALALVTLLAALGSLKPRR